MSYVSLFLCFLVLTPWVHEVVRVRYMHFFLSSFFSGFSPLKDYHSVTSAVSVAVAVAVVVVAVTPLKP